MRVHVIVPPLLLWILNNAAAQHFAEEQMAAVRQRIKSMFYHAYDSYLNNAFPYDELRPLTCDGQDTWGSFSLTLIDALDTLLVLGNRTEFQRVATLLQESVDFDIDVNASVFETNIRVVGGLLSAHMLSGKAGMELEPNWPCSGPLLRMAEDSARKLLPAFQTPTGMPYGTVNLLNGVSPTETPVTCTAGVGTFILEFATLSRLTGDTVFEEVARKALRSLLLHYSRYWVTWTVLSELSRTITQFGDSLEVCPSSTVFLRAQLQLGLDALESIEKIARTPCGYASVKDLRDHQLDNRMESFFLAETIKYLYLLFDPTHFLHGHDSDGNVSWEEGGEGGQCVLGAGGYIFNTEAHPLDPAALYCCSRHTQDRRELRDILLDLSQDGRPSKSANRDTETQPTGRSGRMGSKAGEKKRVLLSCPVQPFSARLAILGQVFSDNT